MQGSHQHTRPAVGKEGQLGPLRRHSPRGAGAGPRAPFWEWFPRVGAVGWMLTACKGLRARGSSAFVLLKDTLLGGFPLGVWLEGHVRSFPSPLQKSKAHRGPQDPVLSAVLPLYLVLRADALEPCCPCTGPTTWLVVMTLCFRHGPECKKPGAEEASVSFGKCWIFQSLSRRQAFLTLRRRRSACPKEGNRRLESFGELGGAVTGASPWSRSPGGDTNPRDSHLGCVCWEGHRDST